MKVRMKVDVSGSRNGQPWPSRGGVVDVPDAEGTQLCSAGMAVPVAAGDAVETATAPDETEKGVPSDDAEKAVEPDGEKHGLTTETAPAAAKRSPGRPAKKSPPPPAK